MTLTHILIANIFDTVKFMLKLIKRLIFQKKIGKFTKFNKFIRFELWDFKSKQRIMKIAKLMMYLMLFLS